MPDGRRAFRLETMHRVLQHPIGIGHALMLSHVVEPGIDVECLGEDTLLRGEHRHPASSDPGGQRKLADTFKVAIAAT